MFPKLTKKLLLRIRNHCEANGFNRKRGMGGGLGILLKEHKFLKKFGLQFYIPTATKCDDTRSIVSFQNRVLGLK